MTLYLQSEINNAKELSSSIYSRAQTTVNLYLLFFFPLKFVRHMSKYGYWDKNLCTNIKHPIYCSNIHIDLDKYIQYCNALKSLTCFSKISNLRLLTKCLLHPVTYSKIIHLYKIILSLNSIMCVSQNIFRHALLYVIRISYLALHCSTSIVFL